MPNSVCLFGPAFSLKGDSRFTGQDVNFQLIFDDQSGADAVLYTEWYLDDILVTGQSAINFAAKIPCGSHTIGARILSHNGWSGIKILTFKSCMVPVLLYIAGANTLNEGESINYTVFQNYNDGTTDNVTDQYTLTSTAGGSFNGSVFTAAVDDNNYESVAVTISAVKDGITGATKQVTIYNTTPVTITAVRLTGPDTVNEGAAVDYSVMATYSNGTQQDVSGQYVFSTPEGSFSGKKLTIPANTITGDTRALTISASNTSGQTLTKTITITDTSAVTIVSTSLSGPDSVNEAASADFSVTATYSDGTQQDISASYTFSTTNGTFAGRTFTAQANETIGDTRTVTITASAAGSFTLTKNITVVDKTFKAGVLVVDLYNNTSLNVIGIIDNPEVINNHVSTYTGNNIMPAGAVPAQALILASDLNSGATTSWRFMFNLAKMVAQNPGTTDFVMYIKGRGVGSGSLNGGFSLRSNEAQMVLNGSPGSYMPSVTNGKNVQELTPYRGTVVGGANGSYAESDLTNIIRFVYNVPNDKVTITTDF